MRAALALLALIGLPAWAAPPDPGAPAGATATLSLTRSGERYALPVARFGPEDGGTRALTGEVVRRAFRLDDPALATAAVIAGYRARLMEQGFEEVFSCTGEACGGFDFRFRIDLLPPPAMAMDSFDFAQLSMRGEGGIWLSILVSRVLDSLHIQTVAIKETNTAAAITASPAAAPPEAQMVLAQDLEALSARLRRDGHVPVAGLDFEVGGAALSPGSAPALEALARLLSRDATLAVVIVGHTDTAGGLEANLDLSQRRAQAVRRALIERGVPEAQLDAEGVAFLAPLTSNATPEGRALNRRVELVLR